MKKIILPRKVKKRDGSVVPFDRSKIQNAIFRAALEVLQDRSRAAFVSGIVTEIVLDEITARYAARQIDVESVQDIVERGLMKAGYTEIARSYILYRERRAELRTAKAALGLRDDLKLSINAVEVLKKRYLLKDDDQNVVEAPGELFRRVARHIAQAEKAFRGARSVGESEEKFLSMMRSLEFIPNSPTLMNAGTSLGQLSACFVIPVEDSIDGIFDALEDMAKIHQTGGGTGFSFSRLRPKGDLVSTTKGEASGPVSFMSIFDQATGVIVQGGRRRGANMGILRCDHPDVIDFIEAKTERGRFTNFNLSVGVTDRFMKALQKNGHFDLVNPRTKQKVRTLKARAVFDLIVNAAWRTGDPGLIFLDEINRRNPTPAIGMIEATNPCGEVPLLPFESCNLGSINLVKMVTDGRFDWQRLRDRIRWSIRFLDNVIEVNRFPLPQIREITFANRKIGLGVMGFADMLIRLGIPYNSPEAVRFARRLMRFIRTESLRASAGLADERGVFPNFDRSVYGPRGLRLRNATVNTVAPTGTISIIAGCSSGIEPLFAVSFVRNVLSGTRLFETNPIFEEMARNRGIYSREMIAEMARVGSLRTVRGVPADLRKLFVTAFDVSPEEHLDIQSAFQAYTDNSVSKTINLPADATVEDVRSIYLRAYRSRCKGITVYRYGSREEQVLSFYSPKEKRESSEIEFVSADSDYSGGCAAGLCSF
ncbi:MAG TPA: adenosylcobalamin-dependent ribonucleoside-diphosphate reductase [Syntrophales bacterium]|nr:adenosylcobalamin-dependent ribonucleoside-diphosphate reductase [Syntrophales bacterium]HRT62250.1 adenosylcobalamin-dependent ribonucleoside-diphosphate reductase [Syntrophales bacterium]